MSLKISQLLDGQLSEKETQDTLAELATDPAQRDEFTLYALIGDTLRGNPTPDDAYTHRILDRLRRDGARMEPGYDPLKDANEA